MFEITRVSGEVCELCFRRDAGTWTAEHESGTQVCEKCVLGFVNGSAAETTFDEQCPICDNASDKIVIAARGVWACERCAHHAMAKMPRSAV